MQSVGSRSQLSAGVTSSDSFHQVSRDEQEEGVAMPTPHFDPFLPRMEDLLRASILPMISFQILKFIWKPCLFSVDSSVCFDRLYVCLVQKSSVCFAYMFLLVACMYYVWCVLYIYMWCQIFPIVYLLTWQRWARSAGMCKISKH